MTYQRMSLEEALKHARRAVPVGLDMSYDADQDALATIVAAWDKMQDSLMKINAINGAKP